jgi:heme A synthase
MKKWAWSAVGFTYFLMVWGNLVSSTGSGLACPDWPLCHGSVTPTFSISVMFEWGHRILAATASTLILITLVKVLRAPAHLGPLKRSGRSLLALLGLQILLGGTTVLLGLSMAVSTIHLIIANLVFAGLITVATVLSHGNPIVSEPAASLAKTRRLALAGLGAMLVQLALGALVRHGHAGLACPMFPGCLDGFLPPLTAQALVAFLHRWWGIALLGVFVQLAAETARNVPSLAPAARRAMGLALAQVFLGIGTVLSGLSTHSRATHAAVGYLLWGTLFYIVLRSGGVRWLWDTTSRDFGRSSDLAGNASPA